MQGGEKIGKAGEFLKEGGPCAFPDRPDDRGAERQAVTALLDQDTVEVGVVPERAGNVVGMAGKADAAQVTEVVELPLHMVGGGLPRAVGDAVKKLSDKGRPAVQFFVEIDMIRCLESMHPEVGGYPADPELRKDVVAQVLVKRIFTGKMSQILHGGSIRLLV